MPDKKRVKTRKQTATMEQPAQSPEPRETAPPPTPLAQASRLIAAADIRQVRLTELSAQLQTDALAGGEPLEVNIEHQSIGQIRADLLDVDLTFRLVAVRNEEQNPPALEIRSVFRLTYGLPKAFQASQQEIQAFSVTNSMLNSWPYWREVVQSTVTRMGLPPLVLPLYRIADSRPAN